MAQAGRTVRVPAPAPSGGGESGAPVGTPGLPAQRCVQLVRSAVCAHLVGGACGLAGADYVESAYFGLVVPGLSGLACGWAVSRAGPRLSPGVRGLVAAVYAAASAAFAFVFASTPYGPTGTWLPPLGCAVAGAVLWPVFDPSPPGGSTRRRRGRDDARRRVRA